MRIPSSALVALFLGFALPGLADDLSETFAHPPAAARPEVLWMWMGSNVSRDGITRDLEALKAAGFGGATVFSLADVCTPWAGRIANSPTPDVVAFTAPWWQLVRHAAVEARRLGLDFGVHNCPGYETSGGPWIMPEFSMQEIVWSETKFAGPGKFSGKLPRPRPDLRARQPFPLYNPKTGKLEKPEVAERGSFFRDVSVLALPAGGAVPRERVIDLTDKLSADGTLEWDAPPGEWILYRFGRTTMGALLQPGQWEAIGLECDKLSREAVAFHLDHIIGEAKANLGDLVGHGFNYFHFDSYEAGPPGWTPKMREEFRARRGYDLTPYLPTLAKRVIGDDAATRKFRDDFQQTIRDLYRENYFPVIQAKLHAAGLKFMCEPYGGAWDVAEVVPHVDRVMTEFWTNGGQYKPYELGSTVTAVRAVGRNLIEAEAFTGGPADSEWSETPAWLKAIGDEAFCDGVNRMALHRFTHQPWGDRLQPGLAMGQWGTHFDRTQTWWEPGKAWVRYLQRCQALLQWGEIAPADFSVSESSGGVRVKGIHRRDVADDIYFVANVARTEGTARCAFGVTGRQPELWNPVTGEMRDLPEFTVAKGQTVVPLKFASTESCFIVFRKPLPSGGSRPTAKNFPDLETVAELRNSWRVQFDPRWGGPGRPMEFTTLDDWSKRSEPGIRFFSGTARYATKFDLPSPLADRRQGPLYLGLGTVRDIARVRLNGRDLGVVWTAPWRVDIASVAKAKDNVLEIEVTNCWANRLIGDEHEPPDCEWGRGDMGHGGPLKAFPDWAVKGMPRPSTGRFTFTTWNYFTRDSPLRPSGLLGPVELLERSAPE